MGRVPVTILIVLGALAPLWMIELSPPLGAALPDHVKVPVPPLNKSRILPQPTSTPNDFRLNPLRTHPPQDTLGVPGDPRTITPLVPDLIERTLTVQNGDTLMPMLIKAGIPRPEAYAAIKALTKHFKPKHIRPGNLIILRFIAAPDTETKPQFSGLTFQPDIYTTIIVDSTTKGGFKAEKEKIAVQRRLFRAEGTIQSSLYLSATKAGVSPAILMEMIRLYSWDVDFQRSIRPGDRFEVMFEKFYTENGEFARFGNVLYGKLILSGTALPLYRFTIKGRLIGYFNTSGKSARKALMRTPIDGARLSSGYGRRRHPILGYTKMHRGLDFAAPRGTPIYAAGAGTVVYRARNGAYGNYIRIRHNSEYSTAYGHMSRFARKIRRGRRVKQGQIIGYVGSTGRSTGPHLHYEVLNRGRQLNPLRLKMPSGKALKGAELGRFQMERRRLDEKYVSLPKPTTIARNKNSE